MAWSQILLNLLLRKYHLHALQMDITRILQHALRLLFVLRELLTSLTAQMDYTSTQHQGSVIFRRMRIVSGNKNGLNIKDIITTN